MIRSVRLPGLRRSAAVAAVVMAVWGLAAWWARVERVSPDRHALRATWLSGLEVGYPLAASGLLVLEVVALGLLIALRRRRGGTRTALARAALAGFASLLALTAAEASTGIYLAWAHRVPELAMVKGGPPRTGPGDDVTIVVVGESSAEGVPYRDWLSVGKVVAWQLRRLFPQRTFHLEVQARAGWTLEQMHQKLAESRRRPDVVILYAGHNEFASRYGWSSEVPYYYDDDPRPFGPSALARRLAMNSPICRLIRETRDRELVAARPPGRSRVLFDAPSCTPAEAAERLADFERRIEAILRDCNRARVLPVVVVPPGNDAGFEPNRSILPPSTSWAERLEFALGLHEARRLESIEPTRSIEHYRALNSRHPGFALTHFSLARLLASAGAFDEAYREFVLARDLDAHPMRCPTRFQDVYRRLAPRHHAVLVDGQAVLHARHPRGLLDDHMFNDGFHPSLEGTVALASGILAGLKSRQAFGWPESLPVPVIDMKECADHFDVTTATWKEVCRFAAGFYRTTAPICFDPFPRGAKACRYEDALRRLEAGEDADDLGLPGVGARPVGERVAR
jgi:lysophospholipase L1-like esterase